MWAGIIDFNAGDPAAEVDGKTDDQINRREVNDRLAQSFELRALRIGSCFDLRRHNQLRPCNVKHQRPTLLLPAWKYGVLGDSRRYENQL